MRTVRLKAEASIGLLLADLFVLWFAVEGARHAEAPTWFRLVTAALALVSASLAIRSLTLLLRARTANPH